MQYFTVQGKTNVPAL